MSSDFANHFWQKHTPANLRKTYMQSLF